MLYFIFITDAIAVLFQISNSCWEGEHRPFPKQKTVDVILGINVDFAKVY